MDISVICIYPGMEVVYSVGGEGDRGVWGLGRRVGCVVTQLCSQPFWKVTTFPPHTTTSIDGSCPLQYQCT